MSDLKPTLIYQERETVFDTVKTFKFLAFRGVKQQGKVQELVVVRLPRAYNAGKELSDFIKGVQTDLTGSRTDQWEDLIYLGAITNVAWCSGDVIWMDKKPNTRVIARG